MPESYDPVITIGKGAFITEIIEAAGGHSITADIRQEWPHISMEAVVARAPQALLMMRGGNDQLRSPQRHDRLGHPSWRSEQAASTTSTSASTFQAPSLLKRWRTWPNNFIRELEPLLLSSQPQPPAGCREARCKSATTP